MSVKKPSILNALNKSLRDMEIEGRDAGLVTLARRYAQQIDEAQAVTDAFYAASMTFKAAPNIRRLEALEKRVQADVVLGDLGPKFLAAIEKLEARCVARAKGGRTDANGDRPANPLASLREESKLYLVK